MAATSIRGSESRAAGPVLQEILEEISVPMAVLTEARARRDRVLSIARNHPAVRSRYSSGSVAYGTANSKLEDADGGIKIDRRLPDMREFGPDADEGYGPGVLMDYFGDYVVERLRAGDYPRATADTTGKRAVKFNFHTPVDISELGEPVDPYVDFIIGVARTEARGLWIPNRSLACGWDIADPEHHLSVMNRRPSLKLRSHRAHVIRLAKRAIKRDAQAGGVAVMCSWNVSALAIALVEDPSVSLPNALAGFLEDASIDIGRGLTPDPSPVVDPIELPDNVTNERASDRLAEMAEHAREAATARSRSGARLAYQKLYGVELEAIRKREVAQMNRNLALGVSAAPLVSAFRKPTRSHGG